MIDRLSARLFQILVPLALVVLHGCSSRSQENQGSATEPPPAPEATPEKPGKRGASSISGRITFEGPVPPAERVKVTGDPYCTSRGAEVDKEEVVLGPAHELANVFVYVKSGAPGKYDPPRVPVTLDQKECRYSPRVFGIMTGQPLDILNTDDTVHNVRCKPSANKAFNLGMPGKGAKVTRRFDKPEVMLSIKCDVHGWMQAWGGVVSNPFFAVTEKDGKFRIEELPPGTYTIEAVHEKFGRLAQEVTVSDQDNKSTDLVFKPIP